MSISHVKTCILFLSLLLIASGALGQVAGDGKIAFIRNGDIWLMNTDGSNQLPFVAGIQNAKGKISWSPDGKRLAFARTGSLSLKYPAGGGGQHNVYDLFFAFLDSTNNFWEGFTETLGAQSPDWSVDGSKITFTYDVNAATANAVWPEYRVGFYDVATRVISSLKLPRGENTLFAMSPSPSPDGNRVAFMLATFDGKQVSPIGIVVTSSSEITESAVQLIERARKLSSGSAPSWSPDGNWISYVSSDLSNPGLYTIKPDLTGKKLIHKPSPGETLAGSAPAWSPDSKKLAFGTLNGAIYTVNLDGTDAKLISGPGSDSFPAWSK